MTAYRVGQVLYVIPAKEARILPVQVVQEVVKKTLAGTATTYMVRGSANADEMLSIDEIEGEIFDSSIKVQKSLLDRATNGINHHVQDAVAKARAWWPEGFEAAADDELSALKKVTPNAPTPSPKQLKNHVAELAELAEELRQDNEKLEMELPDGTRVRVNNIKLPDVLQS